MVVLCKSATMVIERGSGESISFIDSGLRCQYNELLSHRPNLRAICHPTGSGMIHCVGSDDHARNCLSYLLLLRLFTFHWILRGPWPLSDFEGLATDSPP